MASPPWAPEYEDKRAPGDLLLVQAFVDTRENEPPREELADTESAARWLELAGITSQPLTAADLTFVRELRESLRALLIQNCSGTAPSESDLAPLRRLAGQAQPTFGVGADGALSLDAAGDELREGLTRLLVIVRDSQRDGTWRRLKACANPDCSWAFYDSSRNGRGIWCDMALCGNRMKNRAFRARQRDA